jgi:FMN phosphatase YigB (HAD superfamily)
MVHFMLQDVFTHVAAAFDHLRFSYQVGAIKLDPRVFMLTLAVLGVRPNEAVFVDDTLDLEVFAEQPLNLRLDDACGVVR